MRTTAFINLWNKRIGAIAWDAERGIGTLRFELEFLKSNLDIAPLMMPLEGGNRNWNFQAHSKSDTFKGLPGMVADILPDKYGNTLINAWLSRQGRKSNSLNPVETLCFIGMRGMGALEFEPIQPKMADSSTTIEISGLVEIADYIMSGRTDFSTNLSADEEKAMIDILKIGTSAGGARAKALIAYNEETQEVKSGQASILPGFTHWLIKLDGVTDAQFGVSKGYGRVEYAYYLMATACGIEMTECRLMEEHGRAHFMTKRFDRVQGEGKIHMTTLCGIQHYDFNDIGLYSYEQLFETMRELGLDYPQAEQMYRRMIFNVVARNCDDHTKNFAFLMDKKGKWSLSPGYDICHAYRPDSSWVSQQCLTVNGKRKDINREDLQEVGSRMNIRKADDIINEVLDKLKQWEFYAKKASVETNMITSIESTFIFL